MKIMKNLELTDSDIWQDPNQNDVGYWSNLDKLDAGKFLIQVQKIGALSAVKENYPSLEQVIYSRKRTVGLELLKLTGKERCIDLGCMWGALTIPLAKLTDEVVGVDQTTSSLKFLRARSEEENLKNLSLVNINLRNLDNYFQCECFDVAVVNGVLEWVPEEQNVELSKYFGQRLKDNLKNKSEKPVIVQKQFLKNVHKLLKDNGKIYLAIENRYDFKMFFGGRDPHVALYLTTVLPKRIASLISRAFLGREYRTWIYSENELKTILENCGYRNIQVHHAFPDYRFPELILHESDRLESFRPIRSIPKKGDFSFKELILFTLELVLFKWFRLKKVAPSFIIIAEK